MNLKSDMPSVQEALQRLEREMAVARQGKVALLKIIHGYGSSGAGGDIRIAVQKRLYELAEAGQIRACIFGENSFPQVMQMGNERAQSPRQAGL